MPKCKNCKRGERRRLDRCDKVVCKMDGSHLPYEHERPGCPHFVPHDPIIITPRKHDPQGRLF